MYIYIYIYTCIQRSILYRYDKANVNVYVYVHVCVQCIYSMGNIWDEPKWIPTITHGLMWVWMQMHETQRGTKHAFDAVGYLFIFMPGECWMESQ